MVNKDKKALVILSGGQDSVTCLYYALKYYGEVEAITFQYGQKHVVEIDAAFNLCEREDIAHKIVNIDFMKDLVKSELTKCDGDVNKTNDLGLPSSFVPNRNALFITLAHAYAQTIKAQVLVMGVCQTDYSGYPDCRQNFIDTIKPALNEGSMYYVQIDTPLMYLTKAQTFKMAADLGRLHEVLEYSHTCYNGDRQHRHVWGYGCGSCPACILRKSGYEAYLEHKK